MKRFVIPQEWRETILAYYLGDKGMAEFEGVGHNLRQELRALLKTMAIAIGFDEKAQIRKVLANAPFDE